jgi:hypothetical protein
MAQTGQQAVRLQDRACTVTSPQSTAMRSTESSPGNKDNRGSVIKSNTSCGGIVPHMYALHQLFASGCTENADGPNIDHGVVIERLKMLHHDPDALRVCEFLPVAVTAAI